MCDPARLSIAAFAAAASPRTLASAEPLAASATPVAAGPHSSPLLLDALCVKVASLLWSTAGQGADRLGIKLEPKKQQTRGDV